jgi:hypothetical protein
MNLDFGFLWDHEEPPFVSLGSIITLRPWRNLWCLYWRNVPLHLTELEQFIDQLDTPIKLMGMHSMHLLSGSWAEGLDVLRKKSTAYSRFEHPSGAECDALSNEDRKAIFEMPARAVLDVSRAEEYIRGEIKQNPLRKDR